MEVIACENCIYYSKMEKLHGAGECSLKNKMVANLETCEEYKVREEQVVKNLSYNPTRQIANIWDISDAQSVRKDLTDEQALKVLKRVNEKMDAEVGINWGVIRYWANELYPNPDYNDDDYNHEE